MQERKFTLFCIKPLVFHIIKDFHKSLNYFYTIPTCAQRNLRSLESEKCVARVPCTTSPARLGGKAVFRNRYFLLSSLQPALAGKLILYIAILARIKILILSSFSNCSSSEKNLLSRLLQNQKRLVSGSCLLLHLVGFWCGTDYVQRGEDRCHLEGT